LQCVMEVDEERVRLEKLAEGLVACEDDGKLYVEIFLQHKRKHSIETGFMYFYQVMIIPFLYYPLFCYNFNTTYTSEL
jgi:hypothetical protein